MGDFLHPSFMKNPFAITVVFLFTWSFTFAQSLELSYDHTSVAVTNLNQSAFFYKEVLQLNEIEVPYLNPNIRWFSLGGPYQLHLIQVSEKPDTEKATHLALHVKSIEAFVSYLNSHEIPYWDWLGEKDKIALRPDGIKQVYIQDPDGHWIEINDVQFDY